MLSQVFQRFVRSESGSIGRDLKEHAAWFAEIKAAKIETIYRPAVGNSKFAQSFGPAFELCEIGGAESDVVHSARSRLCRRSARFHAQVKFRCSLAVFHDIDAHFYLISIAVTSLGG